MGQALAWFNLSSMARLYVTREQIKMGFSLLCEIFCLVSSVVTQVLLYFVTFGVVWGKDWVRGVSRRVHWVSVFNMIGLFEEKIPKNLPKI